MVNYFKAYSTEALIGIKNNMLVELDIYETPIRAIRVMELELIQHVLEQRSVTQRVDE